MKESLEKFYPYVLQYGLNVVTGICIFIIGRWLSKIVSNQVERGLNKAKLHKTLILFLKHLVFYALFAFTIIAALNKLGVQTSSFIAVIGAASLAVGLALQGSLSNFAAGIMIILFTPFEVGDTVDIGGGGAQGMVEEIGIFNTIIITKDKDRIILPNSKVTGNNITVFNRSTAPG